MSSSQSPKSISRSKNLSRDQCLLIYGLRDAGKSYKEIADQLRITYNQVGHALRRGTVSPKKNKGRPPTLSSQDVDNIVEYISSTAITRRMTYFELVTGPFRHLGVSERVIQSELQKRGYRRHPAVRKPPIGQETMRKRKEWAEAHLEWTIADWEKILWTDETWTRDGNHRREWVTRLTSEKYNITCVGEKLAKRNGWMFWGSFAGSEKGPHLFWEKEWRSINSERYCEKIVPLIAGMISLNPWLSVMQDNAPAHSSAETNEEMRVRQVTPIAWPPNSPDLNPIEAVWCWMKDYLDFKYPALGSGKQRSLDSLRSNVKEAWDSVPSEFLAELVRSMPARCRAVIDANGGSTKY